MLLLPNFCVSLILAMFVGSPRKIELRSRLIISDTRAGSEGGSAVEIISHKRNLIFRGEPMNMANMSETQKLGKSNRAFIERSAPLKT